MRRRPNERVARGRRGIGRRDPFLPARRRSPRIWLGTARTAIGTESDVVERPTPRRPRATRSPRMLSMHSWHASAGEGTDGDLEVAESVDADAVAGLDHGGRVELLDDGRAGERRADAEL